MKLTPLDIHQKEFRHSLRGYNVDDVDKFLDQVADEFERLFKENIELNEKLEAMGEKVRTYQDMERTLNNTLMTAQRSAEEIVEKARREAEMVLRDAEVKAKEIIHNALNQKQKTQAELLRIKTAEEDFRTRFRNVLQDHLTQLQEIQLPDDVQVMTGQAGDEVVGDVRVDLGQEAAEPAPEYAEEAPQAYTEGEQAAYGDQPEQLSYAAALSMADAGEQAGGFPVGAEEAEPQAGAEGEADLLADLPESGFVSGLQLGEVAPPDLGPEEPTFEAPREFNVSQYGFGERDEDVDIEEID